MRNHVDQKHCIGKICIFQWDVQQLVMYMKCGSYHKQVKYINRRENFIKKQKMARMFLNSDKREFWCEIFKITGNSKGVSHHGQKTQ